MGGVASHDFSSLCPSIKVGSRSFYFHVSKSRQAFQQVWGWKILLTSCEAKFICGTRGHPALYLRTQPRKDIVEQFQVKKEAPTLPSCSFLVINCELPHNPSSKKICQPQYVHITCTKYTRVDWFLLEKETGIPEMVLSICGRLGLLAAGIHYANTQTGKWALNNIPWLPLAIQQPVLLAPCSGTLISLVAKATLSRYFSSARWTQNIL